MVGKQWWLAALLLMPVWAMAEQSLVGQWVLPVPGNEQCSEHYRFDADGTFQVESGQERVTGRFEVLQNEGLPQINRLFQSDNNMADCFGNAVDQTNQTDTLFLKWQDDNVVEWCSDVMGQNCGVRLYRQ